MSVAVLSRFPSYNSASFLHDNVRDSTRLQCVTVQVEQIPLRIVNLYLKPGASSETNMLNARLMRHAINTVSNSWARVLLLRIGIIALMILMNYSRFLFVVGRILQWKLQVGKIRSLV